MGTQPIGLAWLVPSSDKPWTTRVEYEMATFPVQELFLLYLVFHELLYHSSLLVLILGALVAQFLSTLF